MAEEFKKPFVNPYVDEASEEARFSTFVSMDEAHERWKKGSWRPQKANFELDPALFDESRTLPSGQKAEEEAREKSNRFAFRLQEDIIDADQATDRLDDSSYGSNYRPQGTLGSHISNLAIQRLRYNALADIREELPEDLSYLYGSGEGRRPQPKAKLRLHSHQRLSTPVDKRRTQVERMLPEEQRESPEAIMEDIRRRRQIENEKSGIDAPVARRRVPRGIYRTYAAPGSTLEEFYTPEDHFDVEDVSEKGSWRSHIPEQDGLVPDSRSMPEFGRFSRLWSEISPIDPSRSEMLRHTVNTIYDDDPPARDSAAPGGRFHRAERQAYYVEDADFDPNDRYRRMSRQRRQVSAGQDVLRESILSGEYNNPYVQTSNERLRDVIDHDMRGPGHVSEPEGLTDPALLYEWNMGYSRVNTGESRLAGWMEQQGRLAGEAEQSRYRGSHRTGRPGAYMQREKPYGTARRYPRGQRQEREIHRRDMQQQLQRATEQGIADGQEIIRLQQKARREAEQKRIREREAQRRRAYEQQRRAYEQQVRAYEKQQQQYRLQQEEAMRRQPGMVNRQQAPNMQNMQNMQNIQNTQNTRASAQARPVQAPQYGPMGYYTPSPSASPAPQTGSRRRKP